MYYKLIDFTKKWREIGQHSKDVDLKEGVSGLAKKYYDELMEILNGHAEIRIPVEVTSVEPILCMFDKVNSSFGRRFSEAFSNIVGKNANIPCINVNCIHLIE